MATSKSARWSAGLGGVLAVTLLAAVPYVYVAMTRYIEYDGFWHIFISTQDSWSVFWSEIQANAHPPLFFLLLKLACWVGRGRLAYRLVSLASGLGSVFLLGLIARKICSDPATAWIAALAFGFSIDSLVMSCEVRSYMLSTFFILVALYFLIRILRDDGVHSFVGSLAGFSLAATLALLSHYFAAFFLTAVCVILAERLARNPRFRQNLGARISGNEPAVGFLVIPIPVTMLVLYVKHARRFVTALSHLPSFYFKRGGSDSALSFLRRTTTSELLLFLPGPPGVHGVAFAAILAVVLLLGCTGFVLLSHRRGAGPLTWVPPFFLALILGQFAAASLADAYPYGGALRQQYLLFPFLILSVAICIDQLFLSARWPRRVLVGVVLLAITLNFGAGFRPFLTPSQEMFSAQHEFFRRHFPDARVVYVDQFSLIAFFSGYHDWHWTYLGHLEDRPLLTVYRVSRGQQSFVVVRDESRWNLDFREAGLYADIGRALRATPTPAITVFYLRQIIPGKGGPIDPAETQRTISSLAAVEGLRMSRIATRYPDVFPEFQKIPRLADTE